MTVSTTTSRVEYSGNGSTTAFSVPFYFLASGDLKVYQAGVLKTITTHYTVSGAGNPAGGTVTFLTAPTNGQAIVIFRDPALTQGVDYQPNDPFPAETHETALDRLTMIAQRLKDRMDRAAVLPDSDTSGASPALPAPSANKALLWNSAGTGLQNSTDNFNDIVTNATTQATAAAASASSASSSASSASSSASSASSSASSASASASSAATSASAAAAAAASGMYSAVQDKSADYTVVAGDAGDLIRVDTSGGARTITLPAISSVGDGFKVAIVKWTGDINAVTVARSGSDTINGLTTYGIGSQYSSSTFVADAETSQWFAVASGIGTTNTVIDQFSGTGAQTAFTLSGDPGTENNTQVFISGVYQQKSVYSISATTLTFSVAPPSGTNNVEVVWTQPLAAGVPSDGSVSTAKLADGAVTTAKIVDSNVTTAKIADSNVTTAKIADSNVTTAKIADANVTAGKLSSGAPSWDSAGLLSFNSGYGSTAPVYGCRAWANFSAVSASGTYSQSGTTITVTLTSHGMTTGQLVRLDFTSGTATDGMYAVTVTGANTFTVTSATSATTSGNVTRQIWVRGFGNINNVAYNSTGEFTVTFATAMPDINYAVVGSASGDTAGCIVTILSPLTTSSFTFRTRTDAGTLADRDNVCVSVFR